jgi:peptidoglycan/LPS O-acetylase OafA/YrhL
MWQPVFVVLGGGVLLVLGLLLLVPARRHRFLGLLALLVALAATTAVLVALGGVSWDLSRFDTGIYFAMAVAGLGLLGALKALATRARVAPRG